MELGYARQLPNEILVIRAFVQIGSHPRMRGMPSWKETMNIKFSVKFAYCLLTHEKAGYTILI